MKLVKTVRCKLVVDVEQAAQLKETLHRFAEACNDILQTAKRHKTSNKVRLQHIGYYTWKKRYGLHANLVIRAIARVAAAMKRARKPRSFKADSLDLTWMPEPSV